jgi:tetratricopeptide (TPR) repeat protein
MENLASTYQFQGQLSKAEALYRIVVDWKKDHLGIWHISFLAEHNLACVYYDQERFDEAEVLFRETISKEKAALEDKYPRTLETMHWFACTRFAQNLMTEADELLLQVYEGNLGIYGPKHSSTHQIQSQRAALHEHIKSSGQLGTRHEKMPKKKHNKLGDIGIQKLAEARKLANTLANKGQQSEADGLPEKAIGLQKREHLRRAAAGGFESITPGNAVRRCCQVATRRGFKS